MVAFNFQKRFAPMVEDGRKTHTIRDNHRGAKSGVKLQLYYGMRTKQCRKLKDVICRGSYAITVTKNSIKILGGVKVIDKERFAERDGF
jgi:hypothetical protein